jgi:hypothetical protein
MSVACYSLANAGLARARLGRTDEMAADLEQAVTLAAENGSREEYGTVLAVTGMSLLVVGARVEAATLFSAATEVFAIENLALSIGVTREEMETRLTEAIGSEALAAAWTTGTAMSDRDARDYALAVLGSLPGGRTAES